MEFHGHMDKSSQIFKVLSLKNPLFYLIGDWNSKTDVIS